MSISQKAFLMMALVCTFVQTAWAWDGSGTATDPFLIKSSADWKQLADGVSGGNSYSGTYFEMTADIDAEGVSVGTVGADPVPATISNEDAADMGAYILQSDGDWHPVAGGLPADKPARIPPFRAYLLPGARNADARVSMTLEDTTGIDSIETIDEDGTRRYYDLNGRELQGKPDKGMYIYKGKKYINK